MRVDEVAHAEIAQGAAEENRREMAFAERLEIERLAGLLRQRDLLLPGVAPPPAGSKRGDRRIVRARDRHRLLVRIDAPDEIAAQIESARKAACPWLIGQVTGAVSSARVFSISSRRSKGLRASRSILLMKVTIGMSRMRHTSKSLRVRASMPLAASITMMAESTAVSVR